MRSKAETRVTTVRWRTAMLTIDYLKIRPLKMPASLLSIFEASGYETDGSRVKQQVRNQNNVLEHT